MFGEPAPSNFDLDEDLINDIDTLSPDENSIIATDFTEKEVHDVIFQMERNKPLGARRVPPGILSNVWEVLMTMFVHLKAGAIQAQFWSYNIAARKGKYDFNPTISTYSVFVCSV